MIKRALAAAVATFALASTTALAAITFHSGPTVTFFGANTVSVAGNASGVQGNTFAVLDAHATVQYTCFDLDGAPPVMGPVMGWTFQGMQSFTGQGRADIQPFTMTMPAQPGAVQGALAMCPAGYEFGVLASNSGITDVDFTVRKDGAVIYGPVSFDNPNN